MAEFDGLDGVLRDALQRAAQPGDSAGVADAIRSRVAAGDPGASVASSTAPGWGGGAWSWLPWLGLVVLAGVGGTALGASGVFASEPREILAGYTAVLDDTAPAASCPGGPVIGTLSAGDRVLAVARSEDSAHLGVRDPNDFTRTLWFDRVIVIVDAGQAEVATLPVEACPVATVTIVEPTPVPTEDPVPGPIPVPQPEPQPGDSQAPTAQQWWVDLPRASGVCRDYSGESATVRLLAADNVGVTSVAISWTGVHSGSAQMSAPGSSWSFVYNPPDATVAGQVTFTMVARDAAGNTSAPVAVKVNVLDCPS
jgi:hypothetical protein